MCEDMQIPLLVKVPLEPQLLLASEGGKCYAKEFPESVTAARFNSLVKQVSDIARKE